MAEDLNEQPPKEPLPRRTVLTRVSATAMAGGVVGSYGVFGWMAGRFLYPPRPPETAWIFVVETARVTRGDAYSYRSPAGAVITITRQGDGDEAEDFLALSSTCPHLGCRVHWEPHKTRFFCPCHNAVFDPQGTPVSGPPADVGQTLPRYHLKVDAGRLFIEVPVEVAASTEGDGKTGRSRRPC